MHMHIVALYSQSPKLKKDPNVLSMLGRTIACVTSVQWNPVRDKRSCVHQPPSVHYLQFRFSYSGRTFPRTRGFTEKFHQVEILCIDCLLYFIFLKLYFILEYSLLTTWSVQFSSATQPCPILCDPMGCSTPGLPVHHQLLEFTRTHVH